MSRFSNKRARHAAISEGKIKTGTPKGVKILAGLSSFVLMVGIGFIGQFSKEAVPDAQAAPPTRGQPVEAQGAVPNWKPLTNWQGVWMNDGLIEDATYYSRDSSYNNMSTTVGTQSVVLWQQYDWSSDMNNYKIRPVLAFKRTATGAPNFSAYNFATQAMARIGGTMNGNGGAPLTVYFWPNYAQNAVGGLSCATSAGGPGNGYTPIMRVTSGDDRAQNIFWACMPVSSNTGGGGFNSTTGIANAALGNNGAFGGEADQYTGNLYILASVGGVVDNQNASSRSANTNDDWVFTVWNPETGAYTLSGSIQPGDWRSGMATVPQERLNVRAYVDSTSTNGTPSAPADIVMDADGNIFGYAGTTVGNSNTGTNAGNMSLIRVEPARDADGNIVRGTINNPWRYYVVTKVRKDPAYAGLGWESAGGIYGMAFMNGKVLLGSNTNITGSTTASIPDATGRVTYGVTAMIKIDPLTALARPVWSTQNDANIGSGDARDNASPQGAQVLSGRLYNDIDGDGVLPTDDQGNVTAPGIPGQSVALYDQAGKLLAIRQTDSSGRYDFVVSGAEGATYYVRPTHIQLPLADGTILNAAQTWGAGSEEEGINSQGSYVANEVSVYCHNSAPITDEEGAPCYGAKDTAPDPTLGAVGSTSQPGDWLTYAKAELHTSQQVPTADFAFTIAGSYGDAAAGPTTTNVPVHINAGPSLWLGNDLGSHAGAATDDSHASDDGVYISSAEYGSKVRLGQTVLAGTRSYILSATLNGSVVDDPNQTISVTGWSTGANSNIWNTNPSWQPTVSGGTATGPYQFATSGTFPASGTTGQLRVNASTSAATLPTNANGEYYATDDTKPWTTKGEIEDYTFTVADAVYRPAAKTTGGTGTFTVAGVTLTGVDTDVKIGRALGVTAGSPVTLTAVGTTDYEVKSVQIKDVGTGAVLATPTFTTSGNTAAFSYTPTAGSDQVVEVTFGRTPDPDESSLAIDSGNPSASSTANVGATVKAVATVKNAQDTPLVGETVTFSKSSSDVSFTGDTTCVTKADGACFVTFTSTKAGAYTQEIYAKVSVSGTNVDVSGSPADVTFVNDEEPIDHSLSTFAVSPVVDPSDALNQAGWKTADGTASYTGILTAQDQYGNPVVNATQSRVVFSSSDTARIQITNWTNNNNGTYTVQYTTTTAGADHTASVMADGSKVGDSLPIPFKAGPPVSTCDPGAPRCTTLTVNPGAVRVPGDSTATATLTDYYGNPVSLGTPVTFSVDPGAGGDATMATASGVTSTDDHGAATMVIHGTKAATAYVSATSGGTTVGPVPLVFLAGSVDPATSTVEVVGSPVTVGQNVTVKVTVKDSEGNLLGGIPSSAITVVGVKGADNATVESCTELSSAGIYTCQMTGYVAGDYVVAATVQGVVLGQHPTAAFTAGDVCVGQSCDPYGTGNITWFELVKDGSKANNVDANVVRAHAFDTYGNPARATSVVVTDLTTGELASTINPAANIQTTTNGVVDLTWTTTKSGGYILEGTFNGLKPATGTINLYFAPDAGDPRHSTLEVTKADGTANAPQQVEGSFTLKATIKDANGNPIAATPSVRVNFSYTPTNSGTTMGTYCDTNSEGYCTVTISSKLAGGYQVSAKIPNAQGVQTDIGASLSDPNLKSPQTVSFFAGPVCVQNCAPINPANVSRIEVNPNGVDADGVSRDIVNVYAYDKWGNPVADNTSVVAVADSRATPATPASTTTSNGQASIAYTAVQSGSYQVVVKVDGQELPEGRLVFGFGQPDWSLSSLSISPKVSSLTAPLVVGTADANRYTVTAHVVDSNGNAVANRTVVFPGVANLSFSATSCQTGATGECSVEVWTTKAGEHTVAARGDTITGTPLGNTVAAPFTAGEICVGADCLPGLVTRVTVVQNGAYPDGVSRDIFRVYAFDTYGNPVQDAQVAATTSASQLAIQPDIGKTDENGTQTIWFTSTTLPGGTYPADVAVGGKTPQGSPVDVIFGGVADPAKSSWTVTWPTTPPLVVGRDLINTYTLTATLRDANNALLPGAAMTFAVDPSNGPVFPQSVSCQAGSAGACSVTVHSTRSGTYSVSATTNGASVKSAGGNMSESLAWKADQVCAQASGCAPEPGVASDFFTRVQVSEDNATANGDAHDVATVYAYDAYGNPVPGATVLSTTLDSDLRIESSIVGTNAQGQTTIWYASTKAGAHLASVTVDGKIPIAYNHNSGGSANDPGKITLNFKPGGPSIASSVLAVDPATQTASKNVTVTATIKDANGNPVPNLPVSFAVDKHGTFGLVAAPQQSTATASTNDQGVATVTLTDATVETVNLNATIRINGVDTNVTNSPTTVSFVAGAPCAETSTFVASPLELGVGEFSTATATILDCNGNPVPNVPVNFSQGAGTIAVLSATQKSTGPDGTATITVTDTRAETVVVHATVVPATGSSFEVNSAQSILFAQGAFSIEKSTFTVSPPANLSDKNTWVAADGVAKYTGTVTAMDSNENLLSDLTASDFTFTVPSGVAVSSVTPIGAGRYTVDFTSTLASATPTVVPSYKGTAFDSAKPIPFKGGAPSLTCADTTKPCTSLSADPTSLGVGGTSAVTALVTDYHNNPLEGIAVSFNVDGQGVLAPTSGATGSDGKRAVSLTDNTAETVNVGATIPIGTIPSVAVAFNAGSMDPTKSTVTVYPPTQVVGANVVVTVTARDSLNNPLPGIPIDQVRVTAAAPGGLTGTVTNCVESAQAGVYTCDLTAQKVGTYTVTAVVSGTTVNQKPTAQFTNAGVCVTGSTDPDPDHQTRFVMGLNDQVANGIDRDSATAWAYDCHGNPVPGAAVVVTDRSTGAQADKLQPPTQSVQTGSDGSVVVYWSSTLADTFTAEGTVGGLRPETGVMNQIRFITGPADPSQSQMQVTPASPIAAGGSYTVTATVKDSTGNLLAGRAVTFSLDPASPASFVDQSYCVTGAANTPDFGKCSVQVRSTAVGAVAIHAMVNNASGTLTDVGAGLTNPALRSPQSVAWVADAACMSGPTCKTRVEVTEDGALSNGLQSDVAVAHVYDQYDNPVDGQAVTSVAGDSSLVIVTPIAATGADGTTMISYRSTVAGEHTATVRINGQIPPVAKSSDGSTTTDGTIKLNFQSQAPDPTKTTLSINPTTAQRVGSTFTVTARMKDVNSNAVEGSWVTFPAVADLTFSAQSCRGDSNGECQVTATSTKAGTYTVRGQAGTPLTDVSNTVSATFTSGPICVDPAICPQVTRVDVTQDGKLADGFERDIATVQAYDQYGNPVSNAVVASVPWPGEVLTVQPNIARTNTSGVTTIWYSSTVAAYHKADVTLIDPVTGGTVVPVGSPVSLGFSADTVPDPILSTWTVTPAGPLIVGDGAANTYTATATAKDVNGNLITGTVVSFALGQGQTGPVFSPQTSCQTVNGVCSVRLYSTVSGTYTLSASVSVNGSQTGIQTTAGDRSASLTWKTDRICVESMGDVCPIQTRVQVTTNDRTADGNARDIVTVWAYDKYGNAVEGALVQATAQSSAVTVQSGIAAIGRDGTSTIWYTTPVAGTYLTDVRVDGYLPSGSPAELRFVPGAPSLSCADMTKPCTSLTVVPDSLGVGETSTVTVLVTDYNNNVLVNQQVSLGVTGDGVLTQASGRTGSDGKFVTSLTDDKDETVAVSATVAAGSLTPVAVTFTAGAVDSGRSTVSVYPPTQMVGANVIVTITAKDSKNNPLSGIPIDEIQVSATAPGGLTGIVTNCVESAQAGVYTCDLTAQKAGTYTVTAVVNGTTVNQKPTAQFTNAGVCATGSNDPDETHQTRFDMGLNDQVANGIDRDSATAWAYDCYGNPVPGAVVVVTDKSTGAQAGKLQPPAQNLTTGSNGSVDFYWTSTLADTFTAEGTIDGLRPETGVMNQIRFVSGAADPSQSEMRVSPASPLQAGGTYTVTVTVKDSTGNLLAGRAVAFTLAPTTPASFVGQGYCVTGAANTPDFGKCSVQVRSTTVATVAIHAMVNNASGNQTDVGAALTDPALKSPQSVAWTAEDRICGTAGNPPCEEGHETRVEVVQDGARASGLESDFAKVWAYDQYGNPVSGKAVTSTGDSSLTTITPIAPTGADGTTLIDYRSTVSGAHTATVRINGEIPPVAKSVDGTVTSNGTIKLNFTNLYASKDNSWLTISPTGSQEVGSTFIVTAHLRDENGNNADGSQVRFPVVPDLTFSAQSCVAVSGECQVTVTSTKVGTSTIRAQVGTPLEDVSNTVRAVFTQGPICVNDPTCPVRTRVDVTQDGMLADGTERDIATVQAYDRYGNPISGAVVASVPQAGATLTVQPNIAATNSAGATTIWYSSTVADFHMADVTVVDPVSGATVTPAGSPVRLGFRSSNIPDPILSTWTVAPTGPLAVGTGAANTYTAMATVKDGTGNLISGTIVSFALGAGQSGPVFSPQTSCQTVNGVCSVQVSSTVSGTYVLSAKVTINGAQTAIKTSTTGEPSASIAWKSGTVCSEAEGDVCPSENKTRVAVTTDDQIANGNSRDIVTVWAYDYWGNPIEGGLVQSTTSDTALTVQPGIDKIGKDGTSTIWYTTLVAGRHDAQVTVDGMLVTGGSPVSMTFKPGPVCVPTAANPCNPDKDKQTRVEVIRDEQMVGDADQIKVFAFDEKGNTVPGVEFSITTTDTRLFVGGSSFRASTVVTSDADGVNTVDVHTDLAGRHQARALVNGVELSATGSPMDLRFLTTPSITSPKQGDQSNDRPLAVTGTGQEAGDTVTVKDGGTVICSAAVKADLTWTCDATLADGDHALTATTVTANGNSSSPSAPVVITVDTDAPSEPVVDPTNGSEVSGSGEPGSTVTVKDEKGEPVPGCVDVAVGQSGRFSCKPETPLTPGTSVTVTAKDPAGNESKPVTVEVNALDVEIKTGGGATGSASVRGLAAGLMVATIGVWVGVERHRTARRG